MSLRIKLLLYLVNSLSCLLIWRVFFFYKSLMLFLALVINLFLIFYQLRIDTCWVFSKEALMVTNLNNLSGFEHDDLISILYG